MTILTAPAPSVNTDSRRVPYAGVWISGAELARIMAARRRAYGARTGSPYDPALDEAMDAAGLAELARIVLEQDAEFDRRAEASAQLDRLEAGYCC